MALMLWLTLSWLCIDLVLSKGGKLGGGGSGRGGPSRQDRSHLQANENARAFGVVIMSLGGTRRRYGTYEDAADNSKCTMESIETVHSTCSNVMTNESLCYDCMTCEDAECMNSIFHCAYFLSAIFSECCEENCDASAGDDTPMAMAISLAAGLLCICLTVACGFIYRSTRATAQNTRENNQCQATIGAATTEQEEHGGLEQGQVGKISL
eukprot:TRINITY_DN18324_c0_g2_i1.p1 TRINITY_DN18324_c0_g2~~TRINITY_DN18324_c0_g2_i1.p1  ORF type:complete len:210 (-),score=21.77 TRINITY_DN18324_c0_g2_i1:129-758(-)